MGKGKASVMEVPEERTEYVQVSLGQAVGRSAAFCGLPRGEMAGVLSKVSKPASLLCLWFSCIALAQKCDKVSVKICPRFWISAAQKALHIVVGAQPAETSMRGLETSTAPSF